MQNLNYGKIDIYGYQIQYDFVYLQYFNIKSAIKTDTSIIKVFDLVDSDVVVFKKKLSNECFVTVYLRYWQYLQAVF